MHATVPTRALLFGRMRDRIDGRPDLPALTFGMRGERCVLAYHGRAVAQQHGLKHGVRGFVAQRLANHSRECVDEGIAACRGRLVTASDGRACLFDRQHERRRGTRFQRCDRRAHVRRHAITARHDVQRLVEQ